MIFDDSKRAGLPHDEEAAIPDKQHLRKVLERWENEGGKFSAGLTGMVRGSLSDDAGFE